jgi:hypothetical protein
VQAIAASDAFQKRVKADAAVTVAEL